MKVKLKEHNSEIQLTYGGLGYDDTRKHLEEGKEYDAVIDQHSWHTYVCINNKSFNSVCFDIIGKEDKPSIKLKAIIVDTDNVFICRIGTDPKTTNTGIANIMPTGIDRDSRDEAIELTNRLVDSWNACSGINPEAVPKLREALKNCVIDAKQALSQAERKIRIKAAEDIIAMAEGGE